MTEDAKKFADVLKDQRQAQGRYLRPVFAVTSVVVVLLAVGFTVLWFERGSDGRRIDGLEKQNAGSQQTIAAVAADAAAARKAAEQANQRLAAAGKPTVPIPSPTTTVVPPPTSAPVSEAQVRSIVSSAIRSYRPNLTLSQVEQIARVTAPKVARPKDGRTPTPEELQPLIANAVASYCTEDRCVGRPGKDAPPISDEKLSTMIDQALASWCAQRNDCVGEPGADSTVPGPTGPAGRGIVSGPTCLGEGPDSYWLTKYSDDTEQRQDGPCRLDPLLPTNPATK
jgi:hypothetical protein